MQIFKISDRFKRSEKYDLKWMKSNEMGPNSLWLTEFLTERIDLEPGMKVLDLGCGKAMSSIFLAKEFGVQVWATDLWISPSENLRNINEQEIAELVFPVYAEAHSLPYAENFFDVIISIDAYHYFGTDEIYLPYILKFLKKGGTIGIVSPGLRNEISNEILNCFKDFWEPEFFSFHTEKWWREHWEKTGLVEILVSDILQDGWKIWYEWEKELIETNSVNEERGSDIGLLEADGGKYLCFPRLIAKKK